MASLNFSARILASFATFSLLANASFAGLIEVQQPLVIDIGVDLSFEAVNDQTGTSITSNSPQNESGTTLVFNQYDGSDGALTGVMIIFTGIFSGELSTGVQANDDDSFGIGAEQAFTVSNEGQLMLNLVTPSSPPFLGATYNDSVSCAGGNNTPCSETVSLSQNATSMLTPLDLAPYMGAGTFDIDSTLTSMITVSTNPDNGSNYIDNATTFGGFQNARFDGTVTVKYTTDSVSVAEPGVLILLGTGLLALFGHRRRSARA